jgi:hypothetical protein
MSVTTLKPAKLFGEAALWVKAMIAGDRATAEAIAADHGREVWLGLREVPSEFQKWRWIAIRALVPTGGPSLKLQDVCRLLAMVEEELLVDGGEADAGAAALRVKVTELISVATALADEAFEEARRKCYLLGSNTAEWALPDYDVKADRH